MMVTDYDIEDTFLEVYKKYVRQWKWEIDLRD